MYKITESQRKYVVTINLPCSLPFRLLRSTHVAYENKTPWSVEIVYVSVKQNLQYQDIVLVSQRLGEIKPNQGWVMKQRVPPDITIRLF